MQYPPQWQQGYAPPPKKGMSGCMMAFLIVIGGSALLFAGCLAVTCAVATRPKTAAEKAEEKRYAEEAASAAASASAARAKSETDLLALYQKDCKTPLVIPAYTDKIREGCRDVVRDSLKVPGSGDFPSDESGLTTDDGCRRIYTSYVDAKNPFGVKVRTHYACTYDPRTGGFSTKTLD